MEVEGGRRGGEPWVDISHRKITIWCMTLLQTRVDDKIARRFEKAARERGETTYSFLQKVVGEAAAAPDPTTWDNHWKDLQREGSLHFESVHRTPAGGGKPRAGQDP